MRRELLVMAPAIHVLHRPERQRFEADLGGATALCAYLRSGDAIVFTHTEVPPDFEGQGVAADLVQAALAWVRSEGLRAAPRCSYVASYMRRHPEVQDLLAP